jgi:hypothetical protein
MSLEKISMLRHAVALVAFGFASPAFADDGRDLCADRPGLGTPACTVEPGKFVFELGLGDWTRESDGPQRTDTILTGDALLRIGLTSSLEAQVGWTALGHVRERDSVAGSDRQAGADRRRDARTTARIFTTPTDRVFRSR